MSYLICRECGGYYKLQEEESPEDFESCSCGGKLHYTDNIDDSPQRESFSSEKTYVEKKVSNYNLIMAFGGLIGLIGISGIFIINPLLLILVIAGVFIFRYGYNEGKSWRKGARGETLVADFLNGLPEGYFVFNDVIILNGYGNLDHVVIGPNGIFVIETKNFSGNYIVNGDNWLYKSSYKTQDALKNPGKQVKSNSMALRDYLVDNSLNMDNIWINSIVAFNGNIKINKKPQNYDILHPSKVTSFILNKNKKLNEDILKKAVYLVDDCATELSV
ncbi:MAG: nuclease-related domain-containing protein [Methanobacterium sp.]